MLNAAPTNAPSDGGAGDTFVPSGRAAVIICTRDRVRQLAATLEALERVEVPVGPQFELWVIDNGLNHETEQVARQGYRGPIPVRYLRVDRPGLARARNVGVQVAGADLLLFTDDDVRPPADWLVSMCAPLLSGAADVVVGGVAIAPHLERPWLTGMVRAWYAATDHLDPESDDFVGVGANFAIRRQVFDALGGFDERLGAGALGGCEDTLFFLRARSADMRIGAALDCRVEHHFDESRLSRGALLRCAAAYGRSAGYVQYHRGEAEHRLPTLRACRARLGLALRRILRRPNRHCPSVPAWELQAVLMANLLAQYAREARSGPRRYGYERRIGMTAAWPGGPKVAGVTG